MSPMHESYPVPPADTATRRAAQMAEVRDEFDKRMATGVDEYNATHTDEPYDQPTAQAMRQEAVRELASMTTMAEEPIDNRLRRAWLNGFREGFERASYIQRLDH